MAWTRSYSDGPDASRRERRLSGSDDGRGVDFSRPYAKDRTRNLNVASLAVGHPANGVYCLSGLTFAPTNVQVTVGFNGAAISPIADIATVAPCPAGTQITVGTFDVSGATTDNEFMIEMN